MMSPAAAIGVLRRRFGTSIVAIAVVGMGIAVPGCAARGGRGDTQAIEVRVRNTLVPPTSLSVSLLPSTGARRLIGHVRPSATEEMQVAGSVVGLHRLFAETTGGSAIASRLFTVGDDDVIEWDVGMNTIRVITPR